MRRRHRADRQPDVRAGVRAFRRDAARRMGARAPDRVESAGRRLRARHRDAGGRDRVSAGRRAGRARARRRVDAARPAVRGRSAAVRRGARLDAADVHRVCLQVHGDAACDARGRPPVRARRCRADDRAAVPGAADVVLVVHHGAPAWRRCTADGRHHRVPDDCGRIRDAGRAGRVRRAADVALNGRRVEGDGLSPFRRFAVSPFRRIAVSPFRRIAVSPYCRAAMLPYAVPRYRGATEPRAPAVLRAALSVAHRRVSRRTFARAPDVGARQRVRPRTLAPLPPIANRRPPHRCSRAQRLHTPMRRRCTPASSRSRAENRLW
ncbi:hypothetical protein BVI434_2240017 [Burkholderia vietnamiensis]|nr:hypothetical protein BVI434_2240017 [Burkholderia vietnamiensis]